ncbi:hypothetical protein EDC51_10510 [Bibersteinia trehalosi]|uniref:hypothetical protein n=1 Tax=Bibersteinia trehalosi TaxID=47735 RepID=UPI0010530728|nr:hypothetical protein [Bibersteinia trehalosi]TCT15749.1 hypothetical protein EDC51_10510 [Bibersteinia trehalosi]
MKYQTLFFIFISFYSVADPFYIDELETEQADEIEQYSANLPNFAKNFSNQPACTPQNTLNRVNLNLPFDELKLIGIAQIKHEFRALFHDNQRQIIDLKIGDLVEPEQIEIVEINLKQVRYIYWQKVEHCENPTIQSFRF